MYLRYTCMEVCMYKLPSIYVACISIEILLRRSTRQIPTSATPPTLGNSLISLVGHLPLGQLPSAQASVPNRRYTSSLPCCSRCTYVHSWPARDAPDSPLLRTRDHPRCLQSLHRRFGSLPPFQPAISPSCPNPGRVLYLHSRDPSSDIAKPWKRTGCNSSKSWDGNLQLKRNMQ